MLSARAKAAYDTCTGCDTSGSRTHSRVREKQVAKWLSDAGLHWAAWNKQLPETSCGRYRPDFVFEAGTHAVILEVDEFEHARPGYACDNRRMLDVYNAYGGTPVVFVRYNPDTPQMGDGPRPFTYKKAAPRAPRRLGDCATAPPVGDAPVLLRRRRRGAHAGGSLRPALRGAPRVERMWRVFVVYIRPLRAAQSTLCHNMSGRGKGGKGLGKGGAKRHRKLLRECIQGVTKPAIRRLARRGGVKRLSGLIYEETRAVLKAFLVSVLRDAVTYTDHARRQTVTAFDVVYALKRQGRALYGFGVGA